MQFRLSTVIENNFAKVFWVLADITLRREWIQVRYPYEPEFIFEICRIRVVTPIS
jgi:hypothetical protein